MTYEPTQRPYPVSVLPKLIGDAIRDVVTQTGAPDAMCASAALAVTAIIGTDAGIRVKLPTGDIRPASLNFLNVVDSGEGKTGVDRKFFLPIYDHNKVVMAESNAALREYKAQLDIWTAEACALRNRIARNVVAGNDAGQLREELVAHWKSKPNYARAECFILENVTQRPLMEALHGNGKSAVIMTDEASVVLEGGAANILGTYNKLWDGAVHLRLDRADGSVIVEDPRVVVSLSMNESDFAKFVSRRDGAARSSGFLARCLIAYPPPTQGYRDVVTGDHDWPALHAFQARGAELLQDQHTRRLSGDYTSIVLSFSPEATTEWLRMQKIVQQQMRTGGPLASVKDFAAKVMEIVARLAADIHYFLGLAGDIISWETLVRAATVVDWFLYGFTLLFGNRLDVPKWVRDAMWLYQYLCDKTADAGTYILERRLVRKCSKFREPGELDRILGTLASMQLVAFCTVDQKTCIQVVTPPVAPVWPLYQPPTAPSLQPPAISKTADMLFEVTAFMARV